ncbi:Uu.00g056490.m01.CDS01 [Anthostomella pinea]|uniref:Uu.00g056490.m01.CDS01 n=1 Tax=Anthostomella pinea TaxID=933095 RepID=A0AAI8VSA9_9PEZI|nr:Uu.00g056490.m01.CDS01 [Anthostomella pinea]
MAPQTRASRRSKNSLLFGTPARDLTSSKRFMWTPAHNKMFEEHVNSRADIYSDQESLLEQLDSHGYEQIKTSAGENVKKLILKKVRSKLYNTQRNLAKPQTESTPFWAATKTVSPRKSSTAVAPMPTSSAPAEDVKEDDDDIEGICTSREWTEFHKSNVHHAAINGNLRYAIEAHIKLIRAAEEAKLAFDALGDDILDETAEEARNNIDWLSDGLADAINDHLRQY